MEDVEKKCLFCKKAIKSPKKFNICKNCKKRGTDFSLVALGTLGSLGAIKKYISKND